MSKNYTPDLVQTAEEMPLIKRGRFIRPVWPGPCGDVHVYEDRTVGRAVWCSPVIVESGATLTVTDELEVIDHVEN